MVVHFPKTVMLSEIADLAELHGCRLVSRNGHLYFVEVEEPRDFIWAEEEDDASC